MLNNLKYKIFIKYRYKKQENPGGVEVCIYEINIRTLYSENKHKNKLYKAGCL